MNKLANLLTSDAFIPLNRELLKQIKDLSATAYLGYLIDKYKYFSQTNTLQIFDGKEYFFNTQSDIEEVLCLSPYQQRGCLKVLMDLNLVSVVYKNIPPKTYFFIDFDNISKLLDLKELSSKKDTSSIDVKKLDLCMSKNLTYITKNKSTNNNKNNNTIFNTKEEEKEKIYKKEKFTFDDFWQKYDYKISRPKCEKLYAKIKIADREKIFQHLDKYIPSTPEKKYRKHPSTYLNNKAWEDEITTRDNFSNMPNKKLSVSAFDFMFGEVERKIPENDPIKIPKYFLADNNEDDEYIDLN